MFFMCVLFSPANAALEARTPSPLYSPPALRLAFLPPFLFRCIPSGPARPRSLQGFPPHPSGGEDQQAFKSGFSPVDVLPYLASHAAGSAFTRPQFFT